MVFKIIPALESNALFHPLLARFYALVEGFFLDIPQLCRKDLFNGLYAIKRGSRY